MDILTREGFLKHLRDALNHLYDADHLRANPLGAMLGLGDRFDAPAALRNTLIEAVAALKPGDGDPAAERAWRYHDTLFCCYIQQLSQQMVADQLAISPRQLRREQHEALEVLADALWERYGQRLSAAGARGAPPSTHAASDAVLAGEDLAWLRQTAGSSAQAGAGLAAAVSLAQPLAAQYGVRLSCDALEPPAQLAAHPVALQQILLNLLSVAILRVPGGRVDVVAGVVGWEVEFVLRAQAPDLPPADAGAGAGADAGPGPDDADASLDIASRLAVWCGGKVAAANGESLVLSARLPLLEQLPVLVIDDNLDALQMLQRYAAGTRYRVIGAPDPEQAIDLAARLSPQAIVLDVMMPQVDGWTVLGRLRQLPATERIPIVVCTILPQEKLALSLGASGFLRKPVARQAFLSALDLQTGVR